MLLSTCADTGGWHHMAVGTVGLSQMLETGNKAKRSVGYHGYSGGIRVVLGIDVVRYSVDLLINLLISLSQARRQSPWSLSPPSSYQIISHSIIIL